MEWFRELNDNTLLNINIQFWWVLIIPLRLLLNSVGRKYIFVRTYTTMLLCINGDFFPSNKLREKSFQLEINKLTEQQIPRRRDPSFRADCRSSSQEIPCSLFEYYPSFCWLFKNSVSGTGLCFRPLVEDYSVWLNSHRD